jgi:GH24 family phage-related lysozyme (muramidase)
MDRPDVIKEIESRILYQNMDPELVPDMVSSLMMDMPTTDASEPMTGLMGDSVLNGDLDTSEPMTDLMGDSVLNGDLGTQLALDAGFDPETVKTFADIEGYESEAYDDGTGVMTQGYGHTGSRVNEGSPMGQATATGLLIKDMAVAKGRARSQMGAAAFDAMPKNMQHLATQVAFSVKGGMTAMPKLAAAMKSGDMAGVAREYKTHMTTSGGQRKELTNRNSIVYDKFINPSMGQTAMQTTPTSTVVPQQEPEVVYLGDDIHENHQGGTSHQVSDVTSKNTMRNFVDPHYGHLGIA